MFALLLCTGMVIAVREDSLSTFAKVGAVHGALTLGVIYMLGTVLENRYARKVSRGISAKNPRVFAPVCARYSAGLTTSPSSPKPLMEPRHSI